MRNRRLLLFALGLLLTAAGVVLRTSLPVSASQSSLILSPNFQPRILSTSGESPNNIRVIKETHGKTSHLSSGDLEASVLRKESA